MASLFQRLETAKKIEEKPSRNRKRALAPEGLIAPLLEDHLLCWAMQLSPADVHSALLDLDSFRKSNYAKSTAAPSAASPTPALACPHCNGGHQLIDEREGCILCSDCGAITSGAINIRPEYQSPPDVTCSRETGQNNIPGVSRIVLLKDAEQRALSEDNSDLFWEDLEHWNVYCNLSMDSLKEAQRMLLLWKEGSHTLPCRLAAVLLESLVMPCLPKEEEVRDAIRRGSALPRPPDVEPPLMFFCDTCGTGMHTAKDARFHCRVAGVYAPGRKKRQIMGVAATHT